MVFFDNGTAGICLPAVFCAAESEKSAIDVEMHRPGKTQEAAQLAQTAPGKLAGRLGKLPLWQQVMSLALWPFLEQILSFLVSSVDLFLSTRMVEGAERVAVLDALGLGGYVTWLMMILQSATAAGVLAIISRAAGSRSQEEAHHGLTQGILAGLVIGALSGIGIWILIPSLTEIFTLSDTATRYAKEYLAVLCWICPILGILFACTHALRAIGDTRTPFFIMVVVNAVNVSLSSWFVFGTPDLGVAGLAWGSVLAWLLGMLIALALLFRPSPNSEDAEEVTLSLRHARWTLQPKMIARISRVGFPQGLEMFGMWAIHAITLRFISQLPFEGVLGAHFMAIRIESMSFLPGFAIGTAGATLVGQYLGAKNPEMAAKAIHTATFFALVFMSVIGLLFIIAPESLVHIILPGGDTQAAGIIALAAPLVFLCGAFQPALAVALVMKSSLRGAGDTRTVMRYSFTSMLFFRALLVPICVTYFGFGLKGIWYLMLTDITVQALLFYRVFRKGDWKTIKV